MLLAFLGCEFCLPVPVRRCRLCLICLTRAGMPVICSRSRSSAWSAPDRPRDQTASGRCTGPAETARPHPPLDDLAPPSPSTLTLVPPTHSAWPRVRPGQIAIGGCRTTGYAHASGLTAHKREGNGRGLNRRLGPVDGYLGSRTGRAVPAGGCTVPPAAGQDVGGNPRHRRPLWCSRCPSTPRPTSYCIAARSRCLSR